MDNAMAMEFMILKANKCMKETMSKIRLMAMECGSILKDTCMLDKSCTTKSMVQVHLLLLLMIAMKDNGRMIKGMEREDLCLQMVIQERAIGLKDLNMVKQLISLLMETKLKKSGFLENRLIENH